MKILYLVSGVGNLKASGSNYIQELIFRLSAKPNVECTIISPIYSHSGNNLEQWSKEVKNKYATEIIFVKLPKSVESNFLFQLVLTPIYTTLAAARELSKNKYDVIHEFTSIPIIQYRTALLKTIFKLKSVITISVYNKTLLGSLVWLKFLNFNNQIIVQTKDQMSEHFKLIPPPVEVIKTKAKKQKGINILYFGPLTKEKGFFDLVKAINLLNKTEAEKIKLKIISYPSKRFSKSKINIKKYFIQNINFEFINKEVDVAKQIASSNLVILPQQTGHGSTIPPISCIEVLLLNKQLLATNIIGNRDLFNNPDKILISPQNPEELAHKISVFLTKGKLYSSKNINLQFLKQCNYVITTQKYLEIYKNLIKNN